MDGLLIEYEKGKVINSELIIEETFCPPFERFELIGFFDGASTRKRGYAPLGAYGCLLKNSDGAIIWQKDGKVEIDDVVTNNLAESVGLLNLLEALEDMKVSK